METPTANTDSTTTPVDLTIYWETLYFSVGPLTCLIAASRGQRAWAKWEILLTLAVAGTFAYRPELILNTVMNTPITDFHLFLCVLYACYFFVSIFHPLLLLNSKDVSILYGHYFGRIVAGSLIVIEDILVYDGGSSVHWNYKYLCLKTSMVLTSVLINAYFLSKTPKPSGQNPFVDFANSIGKLDFYILFVYGIYLYAFPDNFNQGLAENVKGYVANDSYRSLTRTFGAFVVSNSIESFCLSEFKFIRDKKRLLFARFLAALVEFGAFYAGHAFFHIYSFETMRIWLAINVVYNLIIFFGFIMTPREHKKVQ